MYTVSSLKHLRYGLEEVSNEGAMHITSFTSESFSDSQSKFNDACLYLKSLGKGHIKHYKEIKPSGK